MERKAYGGYQNHQYLSELGQVATNMLAFPFHLSLFPVALQEQRCETDQNLAMKSQKVLSDCILRKERSPLVQACPGSLLLRLQFTAMCSPAASLTAMCLQSYASSLFGICIPVTLQTFSATTHQQHVVCPCSSSSPSNSIGPFKLHTITIYQHLQFH